MKRALILILALLLTLKVVIAQDNFPPDPSEIFTDAVEVIETEYVAGSTPQYSYDNEVRTMTAFDQEGQIQHEYAYPNDMGDIWRTRIRSDGVLLIEVRTETTSWDVYNADEYWLFNLDTGEYSRPEVVCDNQAQALAGEGKWRFYTNPDDGYDYLCFTETGELRNPLPASEHWFVEDDYGGRNTPAISPNGEWLVLGGYGGEPAASYLVVYSYHITNSELILLGRIDYDVSDYVSVLDLWVSDTMVTVAGGSRIGGDEIGGSIYSFDVTQPDSLQFAFGGYLDWLEDTSQWQYLQTDWTYSSRTGTRYDHLNCVFNIYDQDGARSYELGYDCGMHLLNNGLDETCSGLNQVENNYYYLRFDSNPSITSTVMRLDAATWEFTELLDGEIEALLSVSPDGRYLALVADHSGQIDRVDVGCDWVGWIGWDGLPNAQLIIYDTVNEDFVYHSTAFGGLGASIQWLGAENFLLGLDTQDARFYVDEDDFYPIPTNDTLNLIMSSTVRTFEGIEYDTEIVSRSPDDLQFITADGLFIDFATMSRTIFLSEQTINNRSIPRQYEWNDDGTIRVTFDYFARGTVMYTIRVTPTTSP